MMNKIIRTTLITLLLTFAAHAAAQDVYKRQVSVRKQWNSPAKKESK